METGGIPIIDLSLVNSPTDEIGEASETLGFFHGAAAETLRKLEWTSRELFGQAKEEKLKVRRAEVNTQGYFDAEITKNVKDWKEVLDFTFREPSLIPASSDTNDSNLTHLINRWPLYPSNFRTTPPRIDPFDEFNSCSPTLDLRQCIAFWAARIDATYPIIPSDRVTRHAEILVNAMKGMSTLLEEEFSKELVENSRIRELSDHSPDSSIDWDSGWSQDYVEDVPTRLLDLVPKPEINHVRDLPSSGVYHHDALSIRISIGDWDVHATVLDTQGSINICPLCTAKTLGLDLSQLSPTDDLIKWSDGSMQKVIGVMKIKFGLAGVSYESYFHLIDTPSTYNLILGRHWLHSAKNVSSTNYTYE